MPSLKGTVVLCKCLPSGRGEEWELGNVFAHHGDFCLWRLSRVFSKKQFIIALFSPPLIVSASSDGREEKRNNSGFSLGTQARNLKFSSSCFQVHQTEPYRLLLNFLFIYCHSTMFTLSVYFLNLYDIIRLQSFSQNKLRFEIKLTL